MARRDESTLGGPSSFSSLTDWIRCLPPELVLQILTYLPFEDLLAFGSTSRLNNEYHIVSMKRLRLGVFEKRVHSIISLLQAGWASPDHLGSGWVDQEAERSYTISVVQQPVKSTKQWPLRGSPCHTVYPRNSGPKLREKPQSQEQMIRIQNRIIASVLRRYGPSLRNLEFMAYDLNTHGASALGTRCQHTLRHLALRFEHQHIRDGVMRPSTWLHPAPGNEAWNLLIGIGRFKDTGLNSLETLILERAGITPWQLMMLVKKNPNLTTLKLRTCRGAQPEFLYWLGGIRHGLDDEMGQLHGPTPGAKLEVLSLEHCHRLLEYPIDDRNSLKDQECDKGFEWVRGLCNLRSLSFSESANIPSELVDRANKLIWKIPEVTLPYCLHDGNAVIAVDPKWT
ncbi:hypothetical protein ASPVEDRAFT_35711 [Aspergillus versicolor CBS 583.65]|uniref:F-box domain-containing protein n=1 Tax=Aspergillus versicolor CBS 583.65 TaxID=1036611 RepID=A0A1L9P477_ASPVE|nr:uncharacterized protein ASPVEDRAFT_35711 [Aspergillus versicolor CBS 583.65]OJI96329.1 hypothetical protein ASPVEDRAFT_35711 [Aspergillus versicolor CBS 583.65]